MEFEFGVEAVALVIVPISLLLQLLMIIGVLQYIIDTSANDASTGPWGVFGTNSVFDISVVVAIVKILAVADVIYIDTWCYKAFDRTC